MKKVKVSKDFILEAHKAACSEWKSKIENELPDLFKPKFEIGDAVFFNVNERPELSAYGFIMDHNDYPIAKDRFLVQFICEINGYSRRVCGDCELRLATNEEVEQALIKEAKRRGFKEGVRFIDVRDGAELVVSEFALTYDLDEAPYNNELRVSIDDFYYGVIFKEGKWAEIITKKKMTVADVEKALGHEVEIVK